MSDAVARMIAQHNRQYAVAIKALQLMQEHHNNRYFSFHCVSHEEQLRWYDEAEKIVAPVADEQSSEGQKT